MTNRGILRAGLLVAVGVLMGIAGAVAALTAGPKGEAAETAKEPKDNFDKNVIDIGIVASDVAKTAAFYKDALGFVEVEGFDVPAAMGQNSGLTDNQAFKVRVFVAADKSKATKVKIMSFPKAPGKKADTKFLHSSYGYRYITVFVNDMTAALARARKAGVMPVKEPYKLADGKNYLALVRDPDGNFVELLGPKL
jgi:lactoylglutathione lyase